MSQSKIIIKRTAYFQFKPSERQEIYYQFIEAWYKNNGKYINKSVFVNIIHPIILSKLSYSRTKIMYKKVINHFKNWVNYIAPHNDKIKALKNAQGWDTFDNKTVENKIDSSESDISESEDEKPSLNISTIKESDSDSESLVSVGTKRKYKLEETNERIKKFRNSIDEENKIKFIKNLSFDKFSIIIKKGGFNLKENKFEKAISIDEKDANLFGVEMLLEMSELGIINDIIYN